MFNFIKAGIFNALKIILPTFSIKNPLFLIETLI